MADAANPSSFIRVPVTKAGDYVEIDTASIPPEAWTEVILQGLKVLVNRGTSKITKETYPDKEQLKTVAMEKAKEQVELVMTNKIKFTGQKAKSTKESGKVMTEARRLARNVVKDAIKAGGGKISHYEAKDITAAANELLKSDPSLVEQAKANLEALEKAPSHTVDIKSLISVSAKKVQQAEAKAAKDKADAPLSAKQAGKPKARKAPQANA